MSLVNERIKLMTGVVLSGYILLFATMNDLIVNNIHVLILLVTLAFNVLREEDEYHFHGIIRSKEGENYRKKLISLKNYLELNETDIEASLGEIFRDECFHGTTIQKATLADELLHDRLSVKSFRFIRKKLRKMAYLTDKRHTEEYAWDLVSGWIVEELVIHRLSSALPTDTRIRKVGIDQNREFQELKASAKADIEIGINNDIVKIDIFADFLGTWNSQGWMDLKRGKISHFKKGELDLVLGFDVRHNKFYIAHSKEVLSLVLDNEGSLRNDIMKKNPKMGSVETYRFPIEDPMTLDELAEFITSEFA